MEAPLLEDSSVRTFAGFFFVGSRETLASFLGRAALDTGAGSTCLVRSDALAEGDSTTGGFAATGRLSIGRK
jgi:hypothetical protein